MPRLVYALFDDAEDADRARADLTRCGEGGLGLDVQPHERQLDANQLPESGTTYGRNIVITTAIACVVFMIAGVGVGLYDVVPGIGPGMGVMLGFIFGVVMGVYTAMQAGTRTAKAPLLELAPRLPQGAVLLTVEVSRGTEADRVIDEFDERGAETSGVC